MPKDPEITWTLTMLQANQIMGTLAKQPFGEVADLIAELQNQAQSQLQGQQMPQMPHQKMDGEARVQ
jgi:hypothetical protein